MTFSTRTLLGRLAPSIYGPTVLFTLGEATMLPLVPVMAFDMGAGLGLSGIIASAAVVGQLAGNLPASWVVSRAGERIAMLLGAAVALLGVVAVALAPNAGVLGIGVFVVGFAASTFGLARHSFMTSRVPVSFRARALSLIGGSHRLGGFAGPFLAAGLLALTGTPSAPVWAFAGCLVLTALLVALAPDPEREFPVQPVTAPVPVAGATVRASGRERSGVLAAVRAGAAPFWRIGASAAVLSGIRSVKDVLIPLWGISIGLDATQVALVVGVTGTIDFALFYVSGQVMDRFGRLWAALPATTAMAVSFVVLACAHDVPGAAVWLVGCAIAIGLGNGLSSGILLTLGADLAPRADPAPYLAAWRTLTDLGGAGAPLAVSALAAFSLPLASGATGVLAALGAAGFARWIPRYIPRLQQQRSVDAARSRRESRHPSERSTPEDL